MAEIYKSLPVTGARRLSYKRDRLNPEEEQNKHISSPILEREVVSHSIENQFNETTEQLAARNHLLNEELLKIKAEFESLEITHKKLLANYLETEEKYKAKGYEIGYKNGQDKAASEEKSRIEALVSAVGVFDHRLSEDIEIMQKNSVLLAYEALILILSENYKTPDFLKAMLESAISKVSEKKNITLHLSKLDYELIKEMLAKEILQLRWAIEIVADDRVKKGGCIIETENGMWDARLDSQLERIKDALLNIHEG